MFTRRGELSSPHLPDSIAGRYNGLGLDQEHDHPCGRARTVLDAFGDFETLPRGEGDGAVAQVNVELAFDDVEAPMQSRRPARGRAFAI